MYTGVVRVGVAMWAVGYQPPLQVLQGDAIKIFDVAIFVKHHRDRLALVILTSAGMKRRKGRRAEGHTGKTYIKYKIVRTLGVGE